MFSDFDTRVTGYQYSIADAFRVVLTVTITLAMVTGNAACARSNECGTVAVNESVAVMSCGQLPPSYSEADLRACCEGEMTLWEGPVPGFAREVSGRFPSIVARDADEAYEVLLELRDVFGIESTEFALQQERKESDGVAYTFVQTLHGVPVEDGTFLVSTDSDGALLMVHGSYVDCGEIAVEPTVSAMEAMSAAMRSVSGTPIQCDLRIVDSAGVEPRDEGSGIFALAWCVGMQGDSGITDSCVVVDAMSGRVLDVRPLSNT